MMEQPLVHSLVSLSATRRAYIGISAIQRIRHFQSFTSCMCACVEGLKQWRGYGRIKNKMEWEILFKMESLFLRALHLFSQFSVIVRPQQCTIRSPQYFHIFDHVIFLANSSLAKPVPHCYYCGVFIEKYVYTRFCLD